MESKQAIQAIFESRKFTKFFSGVEICSPNGKKTTIRIASVTPSVRAPGYRLARHSIITEMGDGNGIQVWGYGESDFKILALQKSISEAVERAAFTLAKQENLNLGSTNGWAAHLSADRARASARGELLERDAALLHWLSTTPLTEIEKPSWPQDLTRWAKQELALAHRFNRLRLLVSHLGQIPTVTTVIHDASGFGFVSQGAGKTLREAIFRALTETCRIADFTAKGFMQTENPTNPSSPEDHARYYAEQFPIPEWLFGPAKTFADCASDWIKRMNIKNELLSFDYQDFQYGDLWVSHCQSREVQNLYFGSTAEAAASGKINFERLQKVCGTTTLCPLPHFVP